MKIKTYCWASDIEPSSKGLKSYRGQDVEGLLDEPSWRLGLVIIFWVDDVTKWTNRPHLDCTLFEAIPQLVYT